MNIVGSGYGDYEIVRTLGQGGMGVVYEAEHRALRRRVALKVLAGGAVTDPIALARLRREALAMGALQHPHVVQVSDFVEGPPPFLVMELLSGQSLRERLVAGGPLRGPDACLIAVQLLSALGAAHRAGIVHRDVKPPNIFVVTTPLTDVYVKLLDFGVAKLMTPQPGPALTSFDSVIGSAPYMAPEQIRGEEIDAKTDIFAVGVTLYEMLAGRRPFVALPNESVMLAILRGGPIAPLGAGVPPQLEALVMRALHRTPSARFLTAEEMAKALLPFVPQASLGAVATTAMESQAPQTARAAPAFVSPPSSIGPSTMVGPPTLALRTVEDPRWAGPPTVSSTLEQTAGMIARQPHTPPPYVEAPGYSITAPVMARPVVPSVPPRSSRWLLLAIVAIVLLIAVPVVHAALGVFRSMGWNHHGAIVGSCIVPVDAAKGTSSCTEYSSGGENLSELEVPCRTTLGGAWSEKPCSHVGMVTGCRLVTATAWFPFVTTCPGGSESLVP
jgi:serine/threonine-protein kinase